MNFVIFSYNFLPANDAEAYCTTRFASALAYCGHNVHVVTLERPANVSQEVYDFLVDKRVKITRIPDKHERRPLLSRLRYVTNEAGAENFSACIKAVKAALKGMSDPILISRANPNSSMIVGWHCRKWAKKWIAHASDPIPIPGQNTGVFDRYRFEYRFWMKRALRDADVISVTCKNAIRAFTEEYGDVASKAHFIVTPHIGHPELPQKKSCSENAGRTDEILIVHRGVLCAGRGGCELADTVRRLNEEGVKCSFVQIGKPEDDTVKFTQFPYVRLAEKSNVDIVYVPDLKLQIPYCAFLSSKIVYLLYGDKPILLFSHPDSASATLSRNYPEAGIYFADYTKPETLYSTLKEVIGKMDRRIDRTRIRMEFTREKVVSDFIDSISSDE